MLNMVTIFTKVTGILVPDKVTVLTKVASVPLLNMVAMFTKVTSVLVPDIVTMLIKVAIVLC